MKTTLLGLALLAVAAVQSPASTVTSGALTRDNNYVTSVHYWAFTVNSASTVAIDLLSHSYFPTYFDPYIFLFRRDGSLGSTDLVTANDDSQDTLGDGSTSMLDSYVSVSLDPGQYLLAVLPYQGGDELARAVSGSATAYFAPYGVDETPPWTAQYQITWDGDISDVEQIPEPASALLTLVPVLGLLAARRLRK